jgi:hypothetical protein
MRSLGTTHCTREKIWDMIIGHEKPDEERADEETPLQKPKLEPSALTFTFISPKRDPQRSCEMKAQGEFTWMHLDIWRNCQAGATIQYLFQREDPSTMICARAPENENPRASKCTEVARSDGKCPRSKNHVGTTFRRSITRSHLTRRRSRCAIFHDASQHPTRAVRGEPVEEASEAFDW